MMATIEALINNIQGLEERMVASDSFAPPAQASFSPPLVQALIACGPAQAVNSSSLDLLHHKLLAQVFS